MILTLFVLGGFFYCKAHGPDVSHLGWLPLSCFVIYILGFSLGFGPIPWLMMGEILPAKIRGSAASVATAFNWSCTFVVTKTFQDLTGEFSFCLTKKSVLLIIYFNIFMCSCYGRPWSLLAIRCHLLRWPVLCDILCARNAGQDAGGHRAENDGPCAPHVLGGQHQAIVLQHVNGVL